MAIIVSCDITKQTDCSLGMLIALACIRPAIHLKNMLHRQPRFLVGIGHLWQPMATMLGPSDRPRGPRQDHTSNTGTIVAADHEWMSLYGYCLLDSHVGYCLLD